MAITIINQPDDYHPAYHNIDWLINSSIKANDQFKYSFEITEVGGEMRTVKVSPRPGDGYGKLDIQQHIRDYLIQDVVDLSQGSPLAQSAAFVEYFVRIREEYKDGNGDIIQIQGPIITGQIAYNSILERDEILKPYTENNFKLTDVNTKLLINVEQGTEVYKDDLIQVHIVADPGTYTLETVQTNKNGGTLVGGGPHILDHANLFRLDLAAQLLGPESAVSFSMQWKLAGVPVSEVFTWGLRDQCSRYTNHKIIYLDSKGSYNTLNFDHASREANTASPKTYKQFIDGLTQQDTSRGITRYFNESSQVFTVNTDNLTDKHYRMLVDLINSERVFLDLRYAVIPGVQFYPIEIITKSINDAKAENQELGQYSIQYRFSFDKISR
jgi:hypothetical protein